MSIFDKFKIGFKKSATSLSSGLRDIIVKKEIDDNTLNKIEDFLIQSDVGVTASEEIKNEISGEKIDPKKDLINEINLIIKKYIINLMKPLEKDNFFKKKDNLNVILISGVNGVGKTTTAINLAACLGVLEKKILLIDADPQANATSSLVLDSGKLAGTYQLIDRTISASELIIETTSPNLEIIPSNIDLVGVEIELVDKENREKMLTEALEPIKESYDYIFIDCPPSLGLITLNCLTAAESVIIPIQCEYFALEGLGKLLSTIRKVQELHNSKLDIEGLLLTMYDSRLKLSNLVIEQVKLHFPDIVYNTIIQRNVRLSEATGHCKSIIKYDATSRGAINYLNLAKEFLEKSSAVLNNNLEE